MSAGIFSGITHGFCASAAIGRKVSIGALKKFLILQTVRADLQKGCALEERKRTSSRHDGSEGKANHDKYSEARAYLAGFFRVGHWKNDRFT
jgi:hypothetical protein